MLSRPGVKANASVARVYSGELSAEVATATLIGLHALHGERHYLTFGLYQSVKGYLVRYKFGNGLSSKGFVRVRKSDSGCVQGRLTVKIIVTPCGKSFLLADQKV